MVLVTKRTQTNTADFYVWAEAAYSCNKFTVGIGKKGNEASDCNCQLGDFEMRRYCSVGQQKLKNLLFMVASVLKFGENNFIKSMQTNIATQPVIFFGHGSPAMVLEETNSHIESWRAAVAGLTKPKAILSISAHWETEGATFVTANEAPKTIHDFGGFPRQMYEMKYPAKSSPELIKRIKELAPEVKLSLDWGYDHGTWCVLKKTHPNADIPVVQLSLNVNLTFKQHYELANKLAPLRDEGYLIIGTGNILHNLYGVNRADAHHTRSFLDFIKAGIVGNKHENLIKAESHPGWKYASPSDEHYLPMLYIAGLQRPSDKLTLFNDDYTVSFTMLGVKYGQ